MAEPEALSVDDALDRLVNQFADPMAFLRELVQNSIDAGTAEVEIRCVLERGTMVVHVDDWGAGMNREIIESKLTRLFSSSKDGDRTMIGKFGIGFVSVFAIEPQAVCVDTSRAGEHWRVLFDERRRFSLIRRDEPVEGTKIRIFKPATRAEFERFRARAREVLSYWCKHVRAEVRFEDELINEPFALDLPCVVAHEQDEETILVGHPHDGTGFAGFYNRGLTLVERSADAPIEGLVFKASSPRLQHTLTRDDVIRDRRYDALVEQVGKLVREPLWTKLIDYADEQVRAIEPGSTSPEQLAALEYGWRAILWHYQTMRYPTLGPVPRGVFRTLAGRVLVSGDLIGIVNASVVVGERRSELSDALERSGRLVVWLPAGAEQGAALLRFMTRAQQPISQWCVTLPPRDADEARRWQPLVDACRRLLARFGAKLADVRLGHVVGEDPQLGERVAITQAKFGEPTLVSECGELGTGLFSSQRVLVLAADHPTIAAALALAQREPELAAYLVVKAFFLGSRLDQQTDERLAVLTHELRGGRRA